MRILVVGSNGILGRHIVQKVIENFGVTALVLSDYNADRLARQKQQIKSSYGEYPGTALIDIHNVESVAQGLANVDFVVIATQQQEPHIQRLCLEKSIHSIDLSVNPEFLSLTLNLNKNHGEKPLQLIAAGLFPGLSGILAKELSGAKIPVDVGLLQSLNGSNGKTGVTDMLKIFSQEVQWKGENSRVSTYPGFSFIKSFTFPKPFGKVRLRLTNFVERKYLEERGILSNFWTAFDHEGFNKMVGLCRTVGVLKLFKQPRIAGILSSLISKQTEGEKNENIGLLAKRGDKEISLVLTSDYEATASCVVAYLKKLQEGKGRVGGVCFPFEVFKFDEIRSSLGDVTVSFPTTSM